MNGHSNSTMEAPNSMPGVALLTGAASGLARATAKTFVRSGVTKLALLDINSSGLEETQSILQKLNPSVETKLYTIDVTSASSVESAFSQVASDFPRIDYAVFAAGITVAPNTSASLSIDDFDAVTNVNYRGLWLCSRQVLKLMSKQSLDSEAYPDAQIPSVRAQRGAIVNFSSGLGLLAMPFMPGYNGSKGAVMALTKSDSLDFADHRIRVNAILPGIIDTPITNKTPEAREALMAGCVKWSAQKRMGEPEEVADMVVFLCSNKASFMTGADVAVDGGWLAGKIG